VPARAVQPRGPEVRRPDVATLSTAIGGVAGVMCVLAVVEMFVDAPPDDRAGRALLVALVAGLPVAVGVYAMRLPDHSRFGLMLVAAGAFWSVTALGESPASLPYSIGRVAAWLVFPVLIALMLTFPHGTLEPGTDRRLVAAVTVLIAVLFVGSALVVDAYPDRTPWATCTTDCPANAFQITSHEPAFVDSVIQPVREAISVLLLFGVALSLARRLRGATTMERRSVQPVLVMSIVSAALLVAYLVVRRVDVDADRDAVEPLGILWALTIPGIALAFLLGLVRRRLHMATVLERLSLELRHGQDEAQLRSALATALEDPHADVLDATALEGADLDGRAVTQISDDGMPVALVHDPALQGDEELLEAVGSLVAAAVRHRALEDELARSLTQLEESRKRIARIADLERARIERDIHDGAQQRLILLRMRLTQAEELLGQDAKGGTEAVRALGDDIDRALDELRALAHGVYPSLLSARGLDDALRSAVIGSPIPVRIVSDGTGRYPPEVESAVYYTCVEAYQNVLKHAEGRTHATITLGEQDGRLSFAVADDGAGFAPPSQPLSGGLANMRDRIEAAGGTLAIDAEPGRGTIVRGVIPV
jgi:signal transduction histidine kinase